MATLKTYWYDLDKLTEEMLDLVIPIIYHIRISKIYLAEREYLNNLKNNYLRTLKPGIEDAITAGLRFYNTVTIDMGEIPKVLTENEIKIAFKNSMVVLSKYLEVIISQLVSDIKAQIVEMKGADMPQDAIVRYVSNAQSTDNPLFHRYSNRLKKIVDDGLDRAGGYAFNAALKKQFGLDKTPFTWITVGDKRVCPDCLPRHGHSMPYYQWLEEGVPRAGFTFCLSSCRCILIPSDYVDDEIDLTKPVYRQKYIVKKGGDVVTK